MLSKAMRARSPALADLTNVSPASAPAGKRAILPRASGASLLLQLRAADWDWTGGQEVGMQLEARRRGGEQGRVAFQPATAGAGAWLGGSEGERGGAERVAEIGRAHV